MLRFGQEKDIFLSSKLSGSGLGFFQPARIQTMDTEDINAVVNNNNIYLLQLGCYPVAVLILHVNKT